MRARFAIASLSAVLALGAVSPAEAHVRQSVSLSLTTTQPGAPTGSTLSVHFHDPAHPAGKPYTIARIVVTFPRGSVIDTTVPAQCKASDAQLMLIGASACPSASRVGGGALVTDIGAPPPFPSQTTNRLTNFNNQDQLIGLAETDSPPTRVVSRSTIAGSTITIGFPAIPGLPPPDPFLAYRSLLTTSQPIVRGGRAYTRTPPVCPAEGVWTATLRFDYRDGVSQTVRSAVPCHP